MNRRSFLSNSALAAAALSMPKTLDFVAPKGKIGLQLYSVRDDIFKNLASTLTAVAKAGYKNVEGFGLADDGTILKTPVKDFRKMMNDAGLSMHSCHSNLTPSQFDAKTQKPTDSFKKLVESAHTLGINYLIHPYIVEEQRTLETIKMICNQLNEGGAYTKKQGMTMGYHNHDFEFLQKASDGRLFYEILLQETEPALVKMEMDLYWVTKAGYQPTDFFRLYPGRFKLFHVKDMAKTEKKETVEVGEGSIDFQAIFNKAAQAGAEWFVVELEQYKRTPLEGVEVALKNLKKLKF